MAEPPPIPGSGVPMKRTGNAVFYARWCENICVWYVQSSSLRPLPLCAWKRFSQVVRSLYATVAFRLSSVECRVYVCVRVCLPVSRRSQRAFRPSRMTLLSGRYRSHTRSYLMRDKFDNCVTGVGSTSRKRIYACVYTCKGMPVQCISERKLNSRKYTKRMSLTKYLNEYFRILVMTEEKKTVFKCYPLL